MSAQPAFTQSEFGLLPMNDFMSAIPTAVKAACDAISLPRPSGVFVTVGESHRPEYVANDTVVTAIHPASLADVNRVSGLIGSVVVLVNGNGSPAVSVLATLRREFAAEVDGGVRLFWNVRSVRNEAQEDPSQLALF
jgi:hypothetical protein